ncbi:hypothetical protein [Cytobacillus sp. IB215665]|uniref:hypothetical protein n=1 Tax=Cytobacillus sp. IB215665 TaxID=3097357 RepID=UPI002A151C9E|nr:hypothetical protein [Cytobacillus sp. IB215665]MDX8365554.1 hypothetical protein [Cytobacillus sp. IB215665]
MLKQKTKVISIAAVSGGGKTTVTKQLTNKLKSSKALYFDDFEFEEYPKDICKWVDEGADYNEWNLTPLIDEIRLLINNKIDTLDYLLLDYPFAYLHSEMRDYIDLTIYIDTPLDVAMARRLLRDFIDNPVENIHEDLNNYLSHGRLAYLEMISTVKPYSDVVIDGALQTHFIVDSIMDVIKNRSL